LRSLYIHVTSDDKKKVARVKWDKNTRERTSLLFRTIRQLFRKEEGPDKKLRKLQITNFLPKTMLGVSLNEAWLILTSDISQVLLRQISMY